MRVGLALALAASIGVGIAGGHEPTRSAQVRPSGLIVFSAVTSSPGYTHLFVADLDRGGVRRLTRGAAGGYKPSWSPDGSRIAFEWVSDGPCNSWACSRIVLINADGTRRRPLTPANLRCEDPAWSPTGDRIAYVQWRRAAGDALRSSIWIRSLDGRFVRRLTLAKAFDSSPVWSPDGTKIVFSRDTGAASANYVVNADGTGLRRLRGHRATMITSWSSDGKRLTGWRRYNAVNDGVLSVVLNADGSGERLLLRGGHGPVWSPDDQFIAFLPEDEDISRGWANVVRANGTGRRRLFVGNFTQPSHLDWFGRR